MEVPIKTPDGECVLHLTGTEGWMVYNLVNARTEALDAAEIETRSPCGGQPWRLLRRKIQAKLPKVVVPL